MKCQTEACQAKDTRSYWFRSASGFVWSEQLCEFHSDRRIAAVTHDGGTVIEDPSAE